MSERTKKHFRAPARSILPTLIFNTMLGIMDIRNEAFYEAENDLASPAYNGDVNRLKTLYGKRSIAEDVAAR